VTKTTELGHRVYRSRRLSTLLPNSRERALAFRLSRGSLSSCKSLLCRLTLGKRNTTARGDDKAAILLRFEWSPRVDDCLALTPLDLAAPRAFSPRFFVARPCAKSFSAPWRRRGGETRHRKQLEKRRRRVVSPNLSDVKRKKVSSGLLTAVGMSRLLPLRKELKTSLGFYLSFFWLFFSERFS
jgi:hypothetical protein